MGEENLIARGPLNAHNAKYGKAIIGSYAQLCGKLMVLYLRWSRLMILNLENEKSVKQQLLFFVLMSHK